MPVEPKIIYLETDEEVTSIIDKLRKTEFKDVVLVVPKQAGLVQSVVNLKLVKKQAEILGKTISIVTQDKAGRTLAEKVGIATSSKVGGKFEVREYQEDVESHGLRGKIGSGDDVHGPLEETEEVLLDNGEIMDNTEIVFKEGEEGDESSLEKNISEEESEDKEVNILPKFPYLKVFVGFFVFLIILTFAGFIYLPRAKATIYMDTEKQQVAIDFTGKKDASLDTERAIIPTKVIEITKETNKTFPATGKKNVGNKATGNLRIANLSGSDISWVSGTRFSPTSNGSMFYKAKYPVLVPDGEIKIIEVEAAEPGDTYNGFGSNQSFTLTAGGLSPTILITCEDGMSGGTSREVGYVTEGDINAAKESVTNDAYDEATIEFNEQVKELKVLEDSKKKEVVSFAANPTVNSEATEFSMTVKVSMKALAFSVDDVSDLVSADVERQLGFAKQVIDSGSSSATVSVSASDLETGSLSATVKSTALVSAKINQDKVRAELTGLTAVKAENYIKGLEGVNSFKFDFWPSFLKIFPRISDHILLSVEIATTSVEE